MYAVRGRYAVCCRWKVDVDVVPNSVVPMETRWLGKVGGWGNTCAALVQEQHLEVETGQSIHSFKVDLGRPTN